MCECSITKKLRAQVLYTKIFQALIFLRLNNYLFHFFFFCSYHFMQFLSCVPSVVNSHGNSSELEARFCLCLHLWSLVFASWYYNHLSCIHDVCKLNQHVTMATQSQYWNPIGFKINSFVHSFVYLMQLKRLVQTIIVHRDRSPHVGHAFMQPNSENSTVPK